MNELIEELEETIIEDENKIVIEIAGKKDPIIPNLRRLNSKGISTCSAHPLANETTPPRGEEVLIMPVGNASHRAVKFAEEFFSSLRMVPIRHTLENHDEDMGPQQGLTHEVQRTVGAVIANEGLDLKVLWDLAPANARLSWLAMWRTNNQPPEISAQAVESFLRSKRGLRMTRGVVSRLNKMIRIVNQNDSETAQRFLTELFERESRSLQTHPISKKNARKNNYYFRKACKPQASLNHSIFSRGCVWRSS